LAQRKSDVFQLFSVQVYETFLAAPYIPDGSSIYGFQAWTEVIDRV